MFFKSIFTTRETEFPAAALKCEIFPPGGVFSGANFAVSGNKKTLLFFFLFFFFSGVKPASCHSKTYPLAVGRQRRHDETGQRRINNSTENFHVETKLKESLEENMQGLRGENVATFVKNNFSKSISLLMRYLFEEVFVRVSY